MASVVSGVAVPATPKPRRDMKGNEQVVAALNDTLRNAHSAYMQFAKHALWFQEKGYGKLAEMEAGESAKEKTYIRHLKSRKVRETARVGEDHRTDTR